MEQVVVGGRLQCLQASSIFKQHGARIVAILTRAGRFMDCMLNNNNKNGGWWNTRQSNRNGKQRTSRSHLFRNDCSLPLSLAVAALVLARIRQLHLHHRV